MESLRLDDRRLPICQRIDDERNNYRTFSSDNDGIVRKHEKEIDGNRCVVTLNQTAKEMIPLKTSLGKQ